MVDFITPLPATYSPVTRYKWQNHGSHPCHDCQNLDGQIRTSQQWEKVFTHKHCHCTLEPVEETENSQSYADGLSIVTYYNLDGSYSTVPVAPICPVISPVDPKIVNPHDFM